MGISDEDSAEWKASIARHEDLTPKVKEVLSHAIHHMTDVKGRLVVAETKYIDAIEPGQHCHSVILVFADGRWAHLVLEETHRGAWGRDSTTHVVCDPARVLYAERSYVEGAPQCHYHALTHLQAAGLLTEDDLTEQWALEQTCADAAKAAAEQRHASEEADRAERKEKRMEQDVKRYLKRLGKAAALALVEQIERP